MQIGSNKVRAQSRHFDRGEASGEPKLYEVES